MNESGIYPILGAFLLTQKKVAITLYNMTVCYYHVTCEFQSESTFHSCLNVKDLLARNRRYI